MQLACFAGVDELALSLTAKVGDTVGGGGGGGVGRERDERDGTVSTCEKE